ncbi:MAG: ThiF family adenylyltransferase [Deltaproteobacteria bacterium]|nr:ThiF family adenylyltransferase [Deltaproteobacteria bacterium]
MRWWEKRKHLLVREKSRIDEKYPDNDFVFEVRNDRLWIMGTILGFFEFECCYPPSYPSAPPDIFPKDRSSKWVPRHQYKKEGRFCLDIREKSWSSRLTAADIIKSLEVLLIAEEIRVASKSDKLIVYEEPEPTVIDRLIRVKQCVIPSDLELPNEGRFGSFKYAYKWKSSTCRIVVTGISGEEIKNESSLAKKVWLDDTLSPQFKGMWIRVNSNDLSKLLVLYDPHKVIEHLKGQGVIPKDLDLREFFEKMSLWKFLVLDEEYPYISFILDCNIEKKKTSRSGTYIFDLRALADRMPSKDDYQHLKNKKVTIIGCGAGGSKDAEYFVKSGVGEIVLIDDDILRTENILRHSCQLDDLSVEKVYAVEDRLKKINPDIEIRAIRKHLDIIDADTDKVIKDSDLIIVATASNEGLFNEYAFSRGIPAIYSKVYPLGFGGEIIRVIPGITPCYECSHQFKEVLIQEEKPDAEFPEIETASYDTLSDGTQIPIPALAVDSDFISLIGVKMGLEVLIEKDWEKLSGSSHIRLWGNKKQWIFDQEFECISIPSDKIRKIPNCIICYGDAVVEEELNKAGEQIDREYDEILSRIKSTANEEKENNH